MTKKQFKKVLGLYKDGLSETICIAAIIEICAEHCQKNKIMMPAIEVAEWVVKFMDEKDHYKGD